MSITKLFEETFYLASEDINLKKKYKPMDLMLTEDIFLRLTGEELIIHYLYSSDQIIIPGEYLNLFISFDRLRGEEIKHSKISSGTDKFLFFGCLFGKMIFSGDKSKSREVLSELVKNGTKGLRDILEDKFGVEIQPWTLRNIKTTIEI